jgi:hemerythrin-like domain-containing protein
MKRHPVLEPFSRDHNDGLHLARALKENRPGISKLVNEAWDRELADHFKEEERLLGPLSGDFISRLINEHLMISELIRQLPESAVELGHVLEDHIRWEERSLFPQIEAGMTTEQAEFLEIETMKMELRRWEHSADRARIVKRRLDLRTLPTEDK